MLDGYLKLQWMRCIESTGVTAFWGSPQKGLKVPEHVGRRDPDGRSRRKMPSCPKSRIEIQQRVSTLRNPGPGIDLHDAVKRREAQLQLQLRHGFPKRGGDGSPG